MRASRATCGRRIVIEKELENARPERLPGEGGRASGLLARRALALPLFWKIVLANATVLGVGTVVAMLLLHGSLDVLPAASWVPALLLLAILAGLVVANALLVRLALHPLDVLEEVAERVGTNDLSVRVPSSPLADARLRRLASVLNTMLERVEASRLEEREGSRRLLALGERDRERVAQSLYDQVAQSLAGLLLQLRMTRVAGARPPDSIAEEIRRLVEDIRRLARDLRPPELDELGVRAALGAYARALAAGRDFEVTLEGEVPEERLTSVLRLEIFRMLEETIQHELVRGASAVVVGFGTTAEGLTTEIAVEGVPTSGVERPDIELLGVRVRARQVGGRVEVVGPGREGVHVRLVVPWPEVPGGARTSHPVAAAEAPGTP